MNPPLAVAAPITHTEDIDPGVVMLVAQDVAVQDDEEPDLALQNYPSPWEKVEACGGAPDLGRDVAGVLRIVGEEDADIGELIEGGLSPADGVGAGVEGRPWATGHELTVASRPPEKRYSQSPTFGGEATSPVPQVDSQRLTASLLIRRPAFASTRARSSEARSASVYVRSIGSSRRAGSALMIWQSNTAGGGRDPLVKGSA